MAAMASPPQPKDGLTLRVRLDRRFAAMKQEQTSWIPHWTELSDYILPRRGRLLIKNPNKGDKRNTNIIDTTGTISARNCAAGMMSGMSSPARPWFKLETHDLKLNENGDVKIWLNTAEQRVRQVFHASNVYNALPTLYHELCVFGTACAIVEDDYDDVIRLASLTVGEYYIALNARRVVDTVYREMKMTVAQVVDAFGYANCSLDTKRKYDMRELDTWVCVRHCIEPNTDRDTSKIDARNMKFRSVYWEPENRDTEQFLRQSGYKNNPIIAPRWDVMDNDIYGRSPGMDALPDVKQLHVQAKRKGQAVEKVVNPPLNVPTSMSDRMVSTLPGGINVTPDTSQGVRSIYSSFNPDINALREDMNATQERVRQAFFVDLFLAISQMEGVQPRNQFELTERKEEKLLMLGPVVERLQNEMLGPLIDRALDRLIEASQEDWARGEDSALPLPPDVLQGVDISVNYISTLAQAQRAVATAGIDRVGSFVAGLAKAGFVNALDKFDADQAIDEFNEAVGAPASIIRSDDKVEQMRQAKQQQEQAMQMAQAAPALKDTASAIKDLSQTDVGGGNGALQSLLGNGGMNQPQPMPEDAAL